MTESEQSGLKLLGFNQEPSSRSSDVIQHWSHQYKISPDLGMINVVLLRLTVKPLFADSMIIRWYGQLLVDELNGSQENNIHTFMIPKGKMACEGSGGAEYRMKSAAAQIQCRSETVVNQRKMFSQSNKR